MKPVSIIASGVVAALCTSTANAQSSCFAPSIGNGTASTSTSYPWNRRTADVRVQYCYDPSEVPSNGPIVITRIRFRPVDSAATTSTWVGGTYGNVEIKMSHGSTAYNQITTDFAKNHGTGLVTAYQGAVALMPGSGTGAGVPSDPYVDITLKTPFVYTPASGPLLIDIASEGAKFTPNSPTGTPTMAVATTFTADLKKVYRMYNLSSYTATTGTVQASVGLVLELVCNNNGVATVGDSCSDGFGMFGENYTTEAPDVGNANFNVQGRFLPPGSAALLVVGIDKNFKSIDLSAAGAPSCFIHTQPLLQIGFSTSAGTPSLSNGRLNVPLGIPNNNALKGAFLRTQMWVADSSSKRPLGAVFTNGLSITVQ